MNTKGIELYLKAKEEMKEYLQDEFDHIKEKYGFEDDENRMLMMAFFLYNCHDTISSIAQEFTNGRLSKSTYDKQVYLSEISSTQQQHFETMHHEDIMDFLDSGVTEIREVKEFINEYFSSRD